ncbi:MULTISPECIES: transcriptional regulator [Bacillus cereus group]|uniref:ArsR/SmtB family transcription factor n=1 Tax=Bacillus cereus group TaxID=86661 RepID=UPI001CFA2783|nr:winged helix-turn-helix domain-containing protein [Bacillus thuringiensis]MDA1634875.1 winged helix-turn-helix domain-containing protein [Bacillus cereus]
MDINELALYKLICDPKRQKILYYATKEPITVKELAEKLNEKQSRLYYHVKKLEESGILEVVDTKAIGNLTEKYYKAKQTAYTLSDQLQKEHSDEIINHTRHIIETGLKKIHLNMKKGNQNDPALISTVYDSQTEDEWRETCDNLMKSLNTSKETADPSPPSNESPDHSKQHTYAYVVISYRVDEAE